VRLKSCSALEASELEIATRLILSIDNYMHISSVLVMKFDDNR